jgi:hypothetical protein
VNTEKDAITSKRILTPDKLCCVMLEITTLVAQKTHKHGVG